MSSCHASVLFVGEQFKGMPELHYIGNELELFAYARNWKAYWSAALRPYLGRNVLDVGAGLGATARLLAAAPCERYVALEPDPALVQRLRCSTSELPPCLEVVHGTIADIPDIGTFDTVMYIDVLEHIEDDIGELRQAGHRLCPEGRLIVLSPAHQWLYSPFDRAVGHVRRYSAAELERRVPRGFRVEKLCYLDSLGLFASLANRMVLTQNLPTMKQIELWDRVLVPISRWVDPLTGWRFGKTVLAVFKKV